jgi:two-component system NtrC family sensor kinase
MIKGIYAFIFCFFLINRVLPQSALPPVYEIKSDTAKEQSLDISFWQKLEDKGGKWTIEEVRKVPLSEKFHSEGLKADSIDTNNIHTYWHRYRLKNIMNRDAKISLFSYDDHFDVFITGKDSTPIQYHSGNFQDWDKKDGLKSAGAIPLVLQPGEEILVYDRRYRKADTNFNTSVGLFNTEKLIQEQYIDYVDRRTNYFGKIHLQEAFVLGLLLLAIFLNLLFYRIVNEKVYLYFALFALLLGINRLWNISLAYSTWEHPMWVEFVPYLRYAWAFIPFFFIQFFRQFFKTKVAYPQWDKLLIGLGILNLLLNIAALPSKLYFKNAFSFFNKSTTFLSFCLIPLCIIITLLLFVRKKEKNIRYVIIGSFPFLLLYLVTSPVTVFKIQIHFVKESLIDNFRLIEVICVSWLVLSFSLILLMRFDRLRKENAKQALDNEKLAREKEVEKNELIIKQKAELEIQVTERTADLRQSLEHLKSTQSQLIQSEKMASLGELTAGIAHEIQNPLNFVNNFSEVNKELLDEMENELNAGNKEEAIAIAKDVKENEEKINYHGQRADAIVKGMLQHSRSSSGIKEPTDINALADEYLRLSYHGFRAKDKTFNATLQTYFD